MNRSHATRFAKGQSGNPNGRPRRRLSQTVSAFDILLNRTLTITQAGVTRTMTVDEALQHKIYEQAVAGKRMAVRALLRMIARREKALAAKAPPTAPIRVLCERQDPANAYDALLILGIAIPDPGWTEPQRETRLLLLPWAVQAALSRGARRSIGKEEVAAINRCTHQHENLKWPRRRST